MKTLEFSSNSWHYTFAARGGYWPASQDFCQYVRCVIWGFIKLVGIACMIFGAIYCVGDYIAWVVECINTRSFVKIDPFTDPWTIGRTITSVVLYLFITIVAIAYAILIADYYQESRSTSKQVVEEKPSFIAEAYRSFKDKVCFRVTFKD